ncbi:MAG TPA: efflux RND transporter periplasmic adaptor subunit, partial [Anaeromyxobacteraceae bacterium]|nr:efflux RND transporter periplasmic adaptor subunit [Anaeromyxobacteraceae bacterium]
LLTAQEEYLAALRWAREGGGSADGLAAAARRRLELLGVSRADVDAIAKRGKAQPALEIRAPVTGNVVEKAAVEGLYVEPGTHLFTVADLSTVWVLADVYERDVSRIRVGQPARLRLAAFPRETFQGKVEFVYPTLDTQTRTLRVRLAFPNPEMKLRPGMFGDAFLALDAAEGLVVPREALVDTGDHQYVFVAQGEGRFVPRVVRIGGRGEDAVEILEGVTAGERVVTTANFLIDSESRLRAAVQGTGTPASGTGAAPATTGDASEAAPAAPGAPAAPHAGHQH